jgi:hypothetical protein
MQSMINFSKRASLALAGLVLTSAAQAVTPSIPIEASIPLTVESTVEAISGTGLYHYSFTIKNTATWEIGAGTYYSPLVEFRIPYFADSEITNITAPKDWESSTLEYSGYNHFGLQNAGLLLWRGTLRDTRPICELSYNANPNCILSGIKPGETLDGFGFDAPYAAVKAPYDSIFHFVVSPYTFLDLGDPPIPGSKLAFDAGLQPVPEPASWALFALGVAALAARRLQRRQD